MYGHINPISMISYGVKWLGPAIIPKNRGSYLSHEKTQYNCKQASTSLFVNMVSKCKPLRFKLFSLTPGAMFVNPDTYN